MKTWRCSQSHVAVSQHVILADPPALRSEEVAFRDVPHVDDVEPAAPAIPVARAKPKSIS